MDALALQTGILAALLSAPSFATREWATSVLKQATPAAVFLLAHHPEAEVRWRVRPFAAGLVWQQFEAEWAGRWPYVDAIEGCPWQGLDLPHIENLPHQCDWENYKLASRIWAKWQVVNGVEPNVLRAILLEAEKRSNYWRRHKQYPPAP